MNPSRPPEAAPSPHFPLAIIGAGALGLSFAARLAAFGPVTVVCRDSQQAQVLRAGVDVGGRVYRAEAFGAEDAPGADWVILLVKAGDTAAAAAIAARMAPRGVLSLQNGLTEDLLRGACTGIQVGQGVTTAGAYRDGQRVVPSGEGETLLPPGFEAVAELLTRAGLTARVEPKIHAARLAKLLVNLAINPLAAILRVPNGALLEAPGRIYLEALVAEAWPVLRAEGLTLDQDAAAARVRAVAVATGANRASMLQDVLAGRPTEIDAITGVFLALARRHGAAVPTHQAVFSLVKLLEGKAGAPPEGVPGPTDGNL